MDSPSPIHDFTYGSLTTPLDYRTESQTAFRAFAPIAAGLLLLETIFHLPGEGPLALIVTPACGAALLLIATVIERRWRGLKSPWIILLPQLVVLVELVVHAMFGTGTAEIVVMAGVTCAAGAIIVAPGPALVAMTLNAVTLAAFLYVSDLMVWQNDVFVWFLCCACALTINLTRRRKLKQDYDAEKRRLESLSGELAHELNNHLMAVSGGLELAEPAVAGTDMPRKGWEMATHGTRRLAAVGTQLAHMAGQTAQPSRFATDLTPHLLSSELASYLPSGVSLRLQKTSELPQIEGNLYQLVSAIGELLQYAGDMAHRADADSVDLSLGKTESGNFEAGIQLRPGSNEETQALAQLFSGDYPAESNNGPTFGHGFGLFYAATIIRQHAGSVRLAEDADQQVLMVLTLPAVVSSEQQPDDAAAG